MHRPGLLCPDSELPCNTNLARHVPSIHHLLNPFETKLLGALLPSPCKLSLRADVTKCASFAVVAADGAPYPGARTALPQEMQLGTNRSHRYPHRLLGCGTARRMWLFWFWFWKYGLFSRGKGKLLWLLPAQRGIRSCKKQVCYRVEAKDWPRRCTISFDSLGWTQVESLRL